jgi:RHS repeat-associated protein
MRLENRQYYKLETTQKVVYQFLKETENVDVDYSAFGLTMSGISSKASNFGEPRNKRKYNSGSELQSEEFSDGSGLELYSTLYRSLDPQIGRWHQIDPKPDYSQSLYSAMRNNPIMFNDPLGDTTWIYGSNGGLIGTINDKLKNQIHFVDFESSGKAWVSKRTDKKYANLWRSSTKAFIGEKGMKELKNIAGTSTAIGKEIAFVGSIGKDREISFKAMPVDDNNFVKSVNADIQVDKNYTKSEQSNLFIFGHIHHNKDEKGNSTTVGKGTNQEMMMYYGEPSYNADYKPILYRSSDASSRGQTPALIVSKWGITVYGTGTSSRPLSTGYFLVENPIVPTEVDYHKN